MTQIEKKNEWHLRDTEWHLGEMEARSAKDVKQPNLESDFFEIVDDIKWGANELSSFEPDASGQVTEYFLHSPYGKDTRWDLYLAAIDIFKKRNIRTVIDLGAANNHFAFLNRKAGLDAYGVEPRRRVLMSRQDDFAKAFGADRKFGFVGSLKTFADYVLSPECDLRVDCVSVLNFLHGKGHDPAQMVNLFKAFDKCARHILITEPLWGELGLSSLNQKYSYVTQVHVSSINGCAHHLFEVCP